MLELLKADARHIPLADESVQCVVTSPPYWGLRKYSGEQELVWGGLEDCEHAWVEQVRRGEIWRKEDLDCSFSKTQPTRANSNAWEKVEHKHGLCQTCGAWRGAYGLEPTVEMYVQHTVEILREIRRVLRDDGVVFWNIGDSYASDPRKGGSGTPTGRNNRGETYGRPFRAGVGRADGKVDERAIRNRDGAPVSPGLKPKDLCLIPFRVALAAQADGWWVRSDIIWAKPNPMPESVTDRPTRSHEYILMLTKNSSYYWDAEAVKEPQAEGTFIRYRNNPKIPPKKKWSESENKGGSSKTHMQEHIEAKHGAMNAILDGGRNLRSVWSFATLPYPEAHFATFPEELPKRCILAATRTGDLVLDPFAGSGTVGKVAIELGRRAILCDLAYQDLASKRTAAIQRPLLTP
jgi:DNA modification methylase